MVVLVSTTIGALERGMGLRRNATRAPTQAPEWRGGFGRPKKGRGQPELRDLFVSLGGATRHAPRREHRMWRVTSLRRPSFSTLSATYVEPGLESAAPQGTLSTGGRPSHRRPAMQPNTRKCEAKPIPSNCSMINMLREVNHAGAARLSPAAGSRPAATPLDATRHHSTLSSSFRASPLPNTTPAAATPSATWSRSPSRTRPWATFRPTTPTTGAAS